MRAASTTTPTSDPIVIVDTVEGRETLADRLQKLYASKLNDTSALRSYLLERKHQWKVWKLASCEAKFSFQHVDTQTFSKQSGFTAEFSLSMDEDVPDVFDFHQSASFSYSHTSTHTFSHGKAFTYTFPVAIGRMCTPSIASYYLRCQGVPWDVLNGAEWEPCSEFTQRFKIDFDDEPQWFVDSENSDWFQYV
ncbi:unnamed protein product [Mortierella alpina]